MNYIYICHTDTSQINFNHHHDGYEEATKPVKNTHSRKYSPATCGQRKQTTLTHFLSFIQLWDGHLLRSLVVPFHSLTCLCLSPAHPIGLSSAIPVGLEKQSKRDRGGDRTGDK